MICMTKEDTVIEGCTSYRTALLKSYGNETFESGVSGTKALKELFSLLKIHDKESVKESLHKQ